MSANDWMCSATTGDHCRLRSGKGPIVWAHRSIGRDERHAPIPIGYARWHLRLSADCRRRACVRSGLGYYSDQPDRWETALDRIAPAHSAPARIDAVQSAWTDRANFKEP